jgi:hypothetical protein
MNCTWTIGAHRGEEVLAFEVVRKFIETFAVASEEDGASSGFVAHANDISLNISWPVWCRGERLVEAPVSRRNISDGRFVEPWKDWSDWVHV